MKRLVIRDPETGDPYLIRWTLLSTPLFGLKLHRVLREDWARDLHDHPWWFFSIVLRGGYVEVIGGSHIRRVRFWNWKRSTDAHRIVRVEPNTWTLVITGRKSREWGFWPARGWVQWEQYLREGDWESARAQ